MARRMRVQSLPLHHQVEERLKALIREGVYKAGDQLPSEEQLKANFGVSRSTLREALRTLSNEGWITSRHGVGTFVNRRLPVIDSGLEELYGVSETIERSGLTPDKMGAGGYKIEAIPAPLDIGEELGLEEGERVFRLERMRTADGIPVVYSINHIATALVESKIDKLSECDSLRMFLEDHCGLSPSYAVATILPVHEEADKLRKIMGIGDQVSFLLIRQVQYTADNRPFLHCLDYYRTDIFKFKIIRRRNHR